MLVRFNSSAAGEMVTMAPTARRLLGIIGKECTARGVITAEQLPDALARLRQAVVEEREALRAAAAGADEDAGDADAGGEDGRAGGQPPVVTLAQRAWPLIELFERTRNEDGYVVWEAARDFARD